MTFKLIRIFQAVIWMLVILPTITFASIFSSFEKSLMPGELAKAHEEFVEDCDNCHGFFQKTKQNQLCLDCHDHKPIQEDIKNKTGYHGKYPGLVEKECKDCHSDHLGENADIALFDSATFDHRFTDFPLNASHAPLPCADCHKKDIPYRKAPLRCYDCHKESEPHEGKLGKDCENCHLETRWLEFAFDHSVTKFKLKGKHLFLQCGDCHPGENYQNTPKKCSNCHLQHDKHNKLFGNKCEKCHNVTGFTNAHFNHDEDTKYKLKGSHRLISCISCHKTDPYKKKTKSKCLSCHKKDDKHKGLYGTKCQDCHTVKLWQKTTFDHDKTDYKLRGKHKKIDCNLCHTGDIYKQELPIKCYDCHVQHDVHHGNQGKACENCHNEKGWLDKIIFNHNLAGFPLLGSHSALSCEDCHEDNNFRATKHQCNICHRKDDHHKQSLGDQCQSCHFAKDWKAWDFDHNKQTDFKLEGKHEDLACGVCHNTPVEKKFDISSNCVSCHLIDDIHEGRFGRTCSQCHNPKDFSKVNVN